ncbi:Nucleoside triphosphate pyrophosphohydrolase [Corynebacterium atrinae]|uniref:MazG nucleotide pyrophosphohydrolase domain-containing protein n=1 Tax=Corynebacterium atrinae TaxID=1336740 RepID=UPI0025B5202D|nr:MazG nucleotide pyrophosphohydrolase domain-containing protein [Corynebacterium atrinae]WJY62907.1 Nucleoside triphosphate pyrophosphohydrolase [Corynebacterium atrinae]
MTVLLLDARWPTLIPLQAVGRLSGPVSFTDEVPISVRWDFDTLLVDGTEGVLVSTNEQDPQVQKLVKAGHVVISAASRVDPVGEAVEVMARAYSVGEWEASQTHRSLLPYLAEEAEEFAEAVGDWEQDGDDQALLSELGDLLLQVLFHAEIASRRGAFDFGDVAGSFVDKLRVRSPYLFDGTTSQVPIEEQERLWEVGKAQSKTRDV